VFNVVSFESVAGAVALPITTENMELAGPIVTLVADAFSDSTPPPAKDTLLAAEENKPELVVPRTVTTLGAAAVPDGNVATPKCVVDPPTPTLNWLTPPTCKSSSLDVARLAVLVTFSSAPVKAVAALFQV
jgi:hypothetical protein